MRPLPPGEKYEQLLLSSVDPEIGPVVRVGSDDRRKALACLACRWRSNQAKGKEPSAYGNQLIGCTGVNRSSIYGILKPLVDKGAIAAKTEDPEIALEEGRRPRLLYGPSDTITGIALKRCMDQTTAVPYFCERPSESFVDTGENEVLAATGDVDRATQIADFIAASSRRELADIIEAAIARLDQLDNPDQDR